MVNILISQDNNQEAELLKSAFEESGDTVYLSSLAEARTRYEEVSPDIVVMNFADDLEKAENLADQITTFDFTACIFALVPPGSIKGSYWAGTRGVVDYFPLTNKEEATRLFNQLTTACNELTHDSCIACWKNRKFTNLKILT